MAGSDEAERDELVKDRPVVAHGGGTVPVLQAHGRVDASTARSKLGGVGVPPGQFVGAVQLQELGVGERLGSGEGQAFGQRLEGLRELDPVQQDPQLGGDDRRGGCRLRWVKNPAGVGFRGTDVFVFGAAGETARAGRCCRRGLASANPT